MGPFDTNLMDDADAVGDGMDEAATFDEADAGADFGSDPFADEYDAAGEELSGDEAADLGDSAVDLGEGADEGVDDMALWNAFEEEVADALDAADDDEFFGRLLGGLGRAAGVMSRGLGGAARIAGRARGFARQAGRVAGRVGRVAGAVSPAAMAAARLAGMLGAPGAANALGQVGRAAQGVGRAAGHARGLAGSFGQAAGGAQGLFAQLSQLLGQSEGADDAFDAVADLYLEDGIDEALPAAVGLAARAAARGLGFRNVGQLSMASRRALVRGVAAAARELVRSRGPQAVRALPGLARSATRVAQRQAPTPQRAVQVVRRGLPQAARRVAQSPRMAASLARARARPPRPLARPTDIGHGMPTGGTGQRRVIHINGPATLTITPR
ncbi:hypothetical protein U5817_02125 [Aromatoleum evansii]|uniref:Uncharacterized protein n=1 Tax=Aromatoleum evansii TaxID=59406 RepID=A0ABZ1AQQ8_AROEV|nr:hypothetical protein U5817_02125 [Aromatoleum evansii]